MIVVAVCGVNHCSTATSPTARSSASTRSDRACRPGCRQLSDGRHSRNAQGDARRRRQTDRIAARIEDEDLERLEEHGSADAPSGTSAAVRPSSPLERLAQFADIRPNDEFYDLGRDAAAC